MRLSILLIFAAAFALPAAAPAANVDFSITGKDGAATITVAGPDFNGTFVIEVHLNSDVAVGGLQYSFIATREGEAPGGANSLFAFTGDVAAGGTVLGNLYSETSSARFAPGDYTPGFDVPNGKDAFNEVDPEFVFRFTGETPVSSFPGLLISHTIKPTSPLAPGNYTFTVGDNRGLGFMAINEADGQMIPRILAGFLLKVSSDGSSSDGGTGGTNGGGTDGGTGGDGGDGSGTTTPPPCGSCGLIDASSLLLGLLGLAIVGRQRGKRCQDDFLGPSHSS